MRTLCLIEFQANSRVDVITINTNKLKMQLSPVHSVHVCGCFACRSKSCSCKSDFSCGCGSLAQLPESFACTGTTVAQSHAEDAGICAAHLLEKVTARTQITTVDPQPFMMPSVSWHSRAPPHYRLSCLLGIYQPGQEPEGQHRITGPRPFVLHSVDKALLSLLLLPFMNTMWKALYFSSGQDKNVCQFSLDCNSFPLWF